MLKKITGSLAVWTARAEMQPGVLGAVEKHLRSAGSTPNCELIKNNNVRSAFFFEPAGSLNSRLFVKWFKKPTALQRIRHLFVDSKARSEWHNLLLIEKRGLPCPRPLAFFEKRTRGLLDTACVITQCIDTAVPLNDFHAASGLPAAQQFELTRQLARLSAAMHAAGVFSRDFHAGNIMIRPAVPQGFELFLIDLHRARILKKLRPAMIVSDLAQLANSLSVSRSTHLRFLTEYYRHAPQSGIPLRECAHRISRTAARLEARRIISRSKRCLKNSSVFEISRTAHERYCGRRDFGYAAACTLIERHLDKRTHPEAVIKKSSKSTLTTHALPSGQTVCVKGYRYRGIGYALKNLTRKSRALKCWIAASGLSVRGLQTPQPQAVIEKRRGPVLLESFYLCSWLEHAPELNTYVCNRTWPQKDRQRFIRALAETIARMHARGVYHSDLKSNNILVREQAGSWEFFLIDLDRVSFSRPLTFHRRANNLAQINASVAAVMTPRDRIRFFRIYSRAAACYTERKRYYKRILTISRTKVTKPYGLRFND